MIHKLTNERARYQKGTLEKIKTSDGLCWYLRFKDKSTNKRVRERVGLLAEYPTKAAAERAVQALRSRINDAVVTESPKRMLDVIDRYKREEMPERYSTRAGYEKLIRVYISPKWGDSLLLDITAASARTWLKGLPISTKYRGHIHGLMRVLFRFAQLWEWYPSTAENPMKLFIVPGSQRRSREPRILTREEFQALIGKIDRPLFRRLILITASLGLRCSESTGLKWEDIDWIGGKIHIQRGVVRKHVGDVKTVHSGKKLPLDPRIAAIFADIRAESSFTEDSDWVFANPQRNGKTPYDSAYLQTKVIRPAAKAAGLGDHIGWHTLRHSYKTWLDENGVELTVQRDLMRHADIRTTAQVYGGVRIDRLRKANQDVVGIVLSDEENGKCPVDDQKHS